MKASYEKLVELIRSADEDVVKGYGGNRAAATRARKTLLEAREVLNDVRKEVLATGKGVDNGGTESITVASQFPDEA